MFDYCEFNIVSKNDVNLEKGVVIPSFTTCLARRISEGEYLIIFDGREYFKMATGKCISYQLLTSFFDIPLLEEKESKVTLILDEIEKQHDPEFFDRTKDNLGKMGERIAENISLHFKYEFEEGKKFVNTISSIDIDLPNFSVLSLHESFNKVVYNNKEYDTQQVDILLRYESEYLHLVLTGIYSDLPILVNTPFGVDKKNFYSIINVGVCVFSPVLNLKVYSLNLPVYNRVIARIPNKTKQQSYGDIKSALEEVPDITKCISLYNNNS